MGAAGLIERVLKDLIVSLQAYRLYAREHALFKNALAKAYESLSSVLEEKAEFVVGIIGEELVCEKEIFFQLSSMAQPLVAALKARGIERIAFSRAVKKEELEKFIAFLSGPKEALPKGAPPKDAEEQLTLLGIRNIQAGKIKVSTEAPISAGPEGPAAADFGRMLSASHSAFSQSLDTVIDDEDMDYLALRLSVNTVIENLLGQHSEVLKLVTVKRYDMGTFVHMMNVCILAIHFATRIGFERKDVLDIGIAALFHDIGKIYISRRILNKETTLSGEEFERIKSHSAVGAELLLKYAGSLGPLPAVVAFEHHLKYNLDGYPKLTFAQKPNIVSLMVSLCDVYDALSTRRSYKSDYPPDMIYAFMIKEKGRLFAPELLEDFFKVMGVWPIGTIVALNDERVAVVRLENEDDIYYPQVEVIHPQDKKEYLDLRQAKGRVKIQRALNPLTEAKEYLPLI
jgi:putative nucleotidyltransferase with HDIG domain